MGRSDQLGGDRRRLRTMGARTRKGPAGTAGPLRTSWNLADRRRRRRSGLGGRLDLGLGRIGDCLALGRQRVALGSSPCSA